MSSHRLATVILLASTLGACASASTEDAASGGADLTSAPSATASVNAAFASLQAMRSASPVGQFDEGGNESTRIRGCWQNPKGSNLTDLQKAVYCAMPLEFRLCNSPVLIKVGDKDFKDDEYVIHDLLIVSRLCQAKTKEQFGARFAFSQDVENLYLRTFLRQQSGLSAADEAALIAAHRPKTQEPFAIELVSIAAGVTKEAILLGKDPISLVKDAQLSDQELASNQLHAIVTSDPDVSVANGDVL